MKLYRLFLTVAFISYSLHSTAQIKLADATPKPGETVSFTYDHAGSIDNNSLPQAMIYFLDNDQFPVADADLKAEGKLLKGQFTIPAGAGAFCIKISYGANMANDKGYLYMVYKDHVPVAGAYANKAYATGLGAEIFGVKKNIELSASLYKKEFGLHPNLEKDYEDLYLLTLFYSSAGDQQLAARRAKALAQSGNEKSMLSAQEYYRHGKKTTQADALLTIIKTRFPGGEQNKTALEDAFDDEQDVIKKDSLYNVLTAKHPAKDKATATLYDYKRIQLAIAHLQQNDIGGFELWEKQVKNKSGIVHGINNITKNWAQNGQHLADAEQVSLQALTMADSLRKENFPQMYTSPKQIGENNQAMYYQCIDTYALILYKQNRYKEALSYEQKLGSAPKTQDADINTHYVQILNAYEMYPQAQSIAEKSFAAGTTSPELKEELEKSYIRINGDKKGFADYLNSLELLANKQQMSEMAKTMINLPAAAFDLQDVSGKHITLASLKGKVVVIDFWANWCAPCKESFPGMQSAIEHYKNDPAVQFVFIDTWENDNNYIADTKKYMAANHYDFQVLFDEKATNGKLSKVKTAYEVDGLPTKVVIDKNGNIRFKTLGYGGSTKILTDEMISMVELAKKQ